MPFNIKSSEKKKLILHKEAIHFIEISIDHLIGEDELIQQLSRKGKCLRSKKMECLLYESQKTIIHHHQLKSK